MPLDVGDEVRIYLYDAQPGAVEFEVTGISEQDIRVSPVADRQAQAITYGWDEISRIDAPRPDYAETSVLVIFGILLLGALSEAGEFIDRLQGDD